MPASLQVEQLTPEDEVEAVRSRLYALLALGFSFPGTEIERSQEELWALGRALYPDLLPGDGVPRVTAALLEPEYINRFDGIDREHYCKPYEGLWRESDRAKQQWEVKQFYGFFGLVPDGARNDMPDHIAAELEFMHVLAYRGLAGGGEARGDDVNTPAHYRAAQRDFLERHVTQWVPAFCQHLAEQASLPFYAHLAGLAGRFVEDDLGWLRDRT